MLVRAGLGLVALAQGATSLWAAFAPRHFYFSYPGRGTAWLPHLGPYNEHLTFDFGIASLGLVALLVAAMVVTTPLLVRVAAGAFCVWSIPHFGYHLMHLGALPPSEQWSNATALALSVVLPVALFVSSWTLDPNNGTGEGAE